ncbi:MAG: hypothetical protein K6F37_07740 [Lachnospiraceae bacterium]|nr:hypothetical protein [Lachnospiraceae bacterium]
MSQAKVDKYKQEKANRAQIMAREKRNRFLTRLAGLAVVVAVVAWAGYSGYSTYMNNYTPDKTEITTDALDEYLSGLSS